MSSKCLPDDEQFNISFIQTVEKYPCLYDSSLKEYSNRGEQDKAWNQIAGLYCSTGVNCRKKWKTLRGNFTRYLKQRTGKSGSSSKSQKQYYLRDVVQFVLPFTKSRPQSGNIPVGTEEEIVGEDYFSVDENEEECTPVNLVGDHSHPTGSDIPCTPASSKITSLKRKAPSKPLIDEMEAAVVGYLSRKNDTKPENPDLNFFRSILPDVAALNPSQKRRFKVVLLRTLESMLQEGNTSVTNASPANIDRPVTSSSRYSSGTTVSTSLAQVPDNHTGSFVLDPSTGMFSNELDSVYPAIY